MTDATVPTDALRRSADRVAQEANAIAETCWPTVEPDALTGSATALAATADRVSERAADVAADLRAWVAAAHAAVDSLEAAERRVTQAIGVP